MRCVTRERCAVQWPPARGGIAHRGNKLQALRTASNLTPVSSSLVLPAANPHSVAISVTLVTVPVPSVPGYCSAANLTLGDGAFGGTPPGASKTGLSRVVPASGSAGAPLPILLARSAPDGCVKVTFCLYTRAAVHRAGRGWLLARPPRPAGLPWPWVLRWFSARRRDPDD
jgi:hypothetical protein